MKKILCLHTLLVLLPYSPLTAMNTQLMPRITSLFALQKHSYSTDNPSKPLSTLPVYEVQKLAQNKQLAHTYLKSALSRDEDSTPTSITTPPLPSMQNAWEKTLSHFSIQEWNSMFLEREEDTILDATNLKYIKKINLKKLVEDDVEINNKIRYSHEVAKRFYNAKPLDKILQKHYQDNLQSIGYPKIPGFIYHWNNNIYGCACSIYPHIYVTSDFLELDSNEQLGILAHEDQHRNNLHIHKKISIYSNIPDKYAQFMEKEADLKACGYSLPIAFGLLNYLKRKKASNIFPYTENYQKAYPSYKNRIQDIQDLINKLELEKKGYAWNPFYKTVGLTEWFKK